MFPCGVTVMREFEVTCLDFLTHPETIPLLCWQHVVLVVGHFIGAVPDCDCH